MQLVIAVVGENQNDLIIELTKTIKECRCGILESRMTAMGQEFGAHLLVDGNWNHIAKLENALEALAHRCGLKVHTLRGQEKEAEPEMAVPYAVDVFASDRLDNINELAAFFTARNISILDFTSSRYPAPYNGSPLFLAHLVVQIPVGIRIVSLRDEFLEFCDQQNLDAILEPIKR
jgi:glycine cleavage system transcriptional repressor